MLCSSWIRGGTWKSVLPCNRSTSVLRCLYSTNSDPNHSTFSKKVWDRESKSIRTQTEERITPESSARTSSSYYRNRINYLKWKYYLTECINGPKHDQGQQLSLVASMDKLESYLLRSNDRRKAVETPIMLMCTVNDSGGRTPNRKQKLQQANLKLREKSKDIIRDLKETKQQMKSRVDKIIMSENIWTVPNLLCVLRMGMAPVLGYMVLNSQFGPAIGLLVIAGVTDLLDGWIARVVPGQSSVMGSFLDPMADKILVGVLFVSLTIMDLIPVPLTALIIARDALLISAGFYIRYQSLDPPRTIARYFNVTQPTAQLAPTFVSKVNTGIQLGLIGATLISTVIPYDVHPYLVGLWFCTATTTIGSGLSYVFAKNTYTFLKQTQDNNPSPEHGTDEKDKPDESQKRKHPEPPTS